MFFLVEGDFFITNVLNNKNIAEKINYTKLTESLNAIFYTCVSFKYYTLRFHLYEINALPLQTWTQNMAANNTLGIYLYHLVLSLLIFNKLILNPLNFNSSLDGRLDINKNICL